MTRFAVSLRARMFAVAALPLGFAVASCGVLSGILPDDSRGAIADAPENEVKQTLVYDRATNRMVALPEAAAAADIMRGKAVVPVGQLEADGRITPVMMEAPKPLAAPAPVVETTPVAAPAVEVQPAMPEGRGSKQPMRIAPAGQTGGKPAGRESAKAAVLPKTGVEPAVAKLALAPSVAASCQVKEAAVPQESGEALMAALARPGSMVLVFSNRTAAGESVRDPDKTM